jgi:hypothetical protein
VPIHRFREADLIRNQMVDYDRDRGYMLDLSSTLFPLALMVLICLINDTFEARCVSQRPGLNFSSFAFRA